MNIEDAIYYLEEIKSDMDKNCNEYIDAISTAIDALKTLKAYRDLREQTDERH